MNILLVAATQFEVKPLLDFLEIEFPAIGINIPGKPVDGKQIRLLITGAGMVNTAFMMGKYAGTSFDLAINAGVCGTFDASVALGDLVHVTEDTLSELGAEDGDDFLQWETLNLPGKHRFSNHLQQKFTRIESLKKVKGITVNTVHGNTLSIKKVKQVYSPDVESMEGAAFYACCKHAYRNYTQVRAVSNYVERRDKSKWQMPLAINNLNDFLIQLVKDPLYSIQS